MPYTEQWNLTFERQLPLNSSLRVSYTGNRGIGLLRFASGNLPDNNPAGVRVVDHPNNAPSVLYPASQRQLGDPRAVDVRSQVLRPAADILCAGSGLPGAQPVLPGVTCPASVPIGAFEYSFRIPRSNERRPNPLLTTPLVVSNSSWSYYHGLQIEWEKRLSRGLNFLMAYTWSKAIDTTSEATAVGTGDSNQLGPDLRNFARGLSRFDTRHRFTFYGTYQFPFFRGRKDFDFPPRRSARPTPTTLTVVSSDVIRSSLTVFTDLISASQSTFRCPSKVID